MSENEPPAAQPDSPVVPIETMSDLEPKEKTPGKKNGQGDKDNICLKLK